MWIVLHTIEITLKGPDDYFHLKNDSEGGVRGSTPKRAQSVM